MKLFTAKFKVQQRKITEYNAGNQTFEADISFQPAFVANV